MLVSNQPLSSAYNRNNEQNINVQFKGTIDKSVTKYLNQVRNDIIKTQKDDNLFGLSTIKETKEAISNIMNRLKTFMSQTNDETTLILKKTKTTPTGSELSQLKFKDKKSGVEIPANILIEPKTARIEFFNPPLDVTTKPASDSFFRRLFGLRGKHKDNSELQKMDIWSMRLKNRVQPKSIDIALQKKNKWIKMQNHLL